MSLSLEAPSLYRFGVFELDTRSAELRRNGAKLRLQDQPYQVLLKLLEHAGHTVTREELRATLWHADTFVDFETGLNTTIKRLRESLGDSAENPTFIETVPKRGYRFIAPVASANSTAQTAPDKLEPVKKNRFGRGVALGASAVFLAIFSVGFTLRHWSRPTAPPARLLEFAALTSDGQAKYGRLISDGSRIYFSEALPQGRILAQVSTRGGETTPIRTTVPDPRPADISPDGTELLILSGKTVSKEYVHEAALWILPVAGGSARPVGALLASDAVWGPRAETILLSSGHDIYVVDRDGSNQRPFLTVSGFVTDLRWSPDKQRLRFTVSTRAMGGTSSIWEVAADGTGLHQVVAGATGSAVCCGTWMAGSNDFLFQWTREGRSDLWEVPGSRPMLQRATMPTRLTSGPMNYSEPTTGGVTNEAFVIGSLPRAELVKYLPQTGEFVPFISGISAEGVAASRDGQWLAYTLFPEGTLWRCNATGGERLQLTFQPMRAFLPRWSPDGKQIAFIGNPTGDHWTTYVIPAEGGVPQEIIPGNDETADATWTPDGKAMIFGPWKGGSSLGIRVLDLNTKQVSPLAGATKMWSPRTSPDGRYIAALSQQDSKMMLFATATQKWEELSDLYSGYPSWSRDGKYLYFQDWSNGGESPSRIVRIRISDRKLETVVDLRSLDRLSIGTFMSWTGLAPDDSVLLSRDISTQEIFALKW
jgi:Tol biopolymer transport system component/DNA-binding winged helix-turn-helix (wHTH) protein